MAEESELRLYGEIGPEYFGMISDTAVIRALDELNGARKITVRLNSPGGDAFMGVAIMNALRRHSAKVIIHVDALAASAASVIAMGGDRIIMHEGSMMMVHRAWTIGMGNAEDFAKVAETLSKVDDNLIEIYQRKTGMDRDKVKKLVDDETWMRADEAVDMGFADEADKVQTGAAAKLPQGWYAKAPDGIDRYAIAARATSLTIAAKAPQDKELTERRKHLERLKTRLLS